MHGRKRSRHPGNARRRAFLVAAFAAALVVAAWQGSTAGATSTALPSQITIGVNMALTGAIAPYDTPALSGFRMAIDEINAKGGIGGKTKIKLVIRNCRSDAAESAKGAQTPVSQKVDFMMVPGDASVAIPAGRLAQNAGIPMMSILASSPSIRTAVGDYFFSNAAADNMVAAGLAKFAYKNGVKRVYTIIGPDAAF